MKIPSNPLMPLFSYTWKEETGTHEASGVDNTFLPGLLRLLGDLQGHPFFPSAVRRAKGCTTAALIFARLDYEAE